MINTTFKVKNAAKFNATLAQFLKKFSNLDKTILMQLYSNKITSTMSNMQKSVIKFYDTDITEHVEGLNITNPIYIPLVIADRLTRVVEFFGEDPINITITHDHFDNRDVALKIDFVNPTLQMELACSKLSFFSTSLQITDVILNRILETDSKLYHIKMPVNITTRLKSLAMSNNTDKLSFISNSKGLFFKGENFEFTLSEESGFNESTFSFSKNNIKNVDSEDYDVYVLPDRVIFKSDNNKSIVVISQLIE